MNSFIRSKEILDSDLNFQVLSWEALDEHEDLDDEESNKVYKIYMFGCDKNGKSVCLRVDKYTPYFYILIPENLQKSWNINNTRSLENKLKSRFKNSFKSIKEVNKQKIKGFTNNKLYKFLQISFTTLEAYTKAKYYFNPTIWNPVGDQKRGDIDFDRLPLITDISSERLYFEIYEHNIDPFIRFTHIQDIKLAGWIRVSKHNLNMLEDEISRCEIVYSCVWNNVQNLDKEEISDFIVASFDIECTSHSKKGFPDYNKELDIITQIGITFYRYGSGKKYKYISSIKSPKEGGCTPIDDVKIELSNNETGVISKFVKCIEKIDPDFIVGFNTYDFDWKYIYNRCKKLNCEYLLEKLSRLINIPAEYKIERLSTSAYGDNNFEFIKMYGVVNLDLRVLVKRDHKLESYSLNNVAQVFTGDKKDDLEPRDLFYMVEGTNDDISTVVKYCVQDTNLVIDLLVKLCIFSNIIGMSNISRVPIDYVEKKGQQVKVFSQLLYEAKYENYLVPTIRVDSLSQDTFTGATVLHGKKGAYYDPIAGLDFASLYPSIMISNNFCYSTIVDDEDYLNLEGVEYKYINWIDNDGKEYNVPFVQNKEGLLPKMLNKLWKERKRVKKLMKTADSEMYKVYDGQQLAIKVSMNSIYGFTGATFGRLPDKRIASAVTAMGRKSIEISKEFAEANYDCEVIYGDTDSIYVKFNTNLNGKEHFDKCFELAQECADKITEKLFKKPMELEFEKMMYPYFLFTAKRYATVIWTNKDKYDYIDYKGIQIKRRDSCSYVKEIGMSIFETLLLNDIYLFKYNKSNENIEIAKNIAKKAIDDLLTSRIPIDKLIVSKAFREGYSYEKKATCPFCDKTWYEIINGKKSMVVNNKDFFEKERKCPSCNKEVKFKKMIANIPHVALAEKMKLRDQFNCPVIGDRIPYVFIKGDPNAKQFEKVEDPKYAVNNMLPIDYMYYFDHQLKSILETIFEIIIDDFDEIFKQVNELKPPKRTRKKIT